MAEKRILMLVGDFVEDYEAMVPYQTLVTVGHQVDSACPGKLAGETVKTAVHDFEGDQTYTEKPGHKFLVTVDFNRLDPDSYHGLVIPGGRAPEYLRLEPDVIDLTRHFFEERKPVAAICHGPQILCAADVLENRDCTAYFTLRPDIERSRGNWVDPAGDPAFVHTEGNLVSAVAWPAHPHWLRQFLHMLGTQLIA